MTSNASTFRRLAVAEDQMIRLAMPRTSAADPAPTSAQRVVVTVRNLGTSRLVAPLTFRLAEVSDVR